MKVQSIRGAVVIVPIAVSLIILAVLQWLSGLIESFYLWMARWAKGMKVSMRLNKWSWRNFSEDKAGGGYRVLQGFGWITVVYENIPEVSRPWQSD